MRTIWRGTMPFFTICSLDCPQIRGAGTRLIGIGGGGLRLPFSCFAQKCFVRFESVFTGVLLVCNS